MQGSFSAIKYYMIVIHISIHVALINSTTYIAFIVFNTEYINKYNECHATNV